jgi:hypothetical protein
MNLEDSASVSENLNSLDSDEVLSNLSVTVAMGEGFGTDFPTDEKNASSPSDISKVGCVPFTHSEISRSLPFF